MATNTAQESNVVRGGFPALGPKVGLLSKVIDLSSTANGDAESVFEFKEQFLVLAAGFEITGALGTSVTVALGSAEDGEQYMAAATASGAGAAALFPLLAAKDSNLYASVGGGTPAATAEVRVWALVADVEDPNG